MRHPAQECAVVAEGIAVGGVFRLSKLTANDLGAEVA